jgi:hypothetical protein
MAGLETSNPSGKWTPINTDEDRKGDFKTIHILSNKLFVATTAPRPFATFATFLPFVAFLTAVALAKEVAKYGAPLR